MRNKILSVALALVMAAGVCPLAAVTASADDDEIVEITTAGTCNYDYANEVAELVNEERAAAGLNTLVNDKRLTEWAMQRAAEQAFYFGHVRPDGTGPGTVSEEGLFRYPYYLSFGENAAGDYKTPTAVMDGWMNSAGHKATLMRDDFTAVGVGCFTTSGGYTYWIQIFAGPSGGSGGDYEIIESTYSGTKEQTFTISIYASYLENLIVSYTGTSAGISAMVGGTATAKLVSSNGAPGYSYLKGVIAPIASDVKDESTGEVIATTSVGSGGVVTITPTAAGSGYLYLYAYEGATPKIVKLTVLSGYTVTFDSCGGSAVASQTVTYGSTATEPETPTRSGYTFEGWYVSDIADEAYSFSAAVPKDLTLYARWTATTTSTSTTTTEETTTAAPETTTTATETTTAKSEETITVSIESDETTSEPQDSNSEPDEENTAPDEETTETSEETTGMPDETTEAPDEETAEDAAETETTADSDVTDDESASEKSDTDNAAVVNNGDNNGSNSAEEENGSNTWIVVLVVVLFVAAAGVTAFVVLKRNGNGDETADIEESADTTEDNSEVEETNGETDGNTDDNTGGDGE